MKPLSKTEILESISEEHTRLVETLGKFGDPDLTIPGAIEFPTPGQSCKDIMFHLTAWEKRMRSIIHALIEDKQAPVYPSARIFNPEVYQTGKHLPLAVVKDVFDRSYLETYQFVKNLTEKQLSDRETWQLVRFNTYSHYRWAGKIIRRWYRQLQTRATNM